MAAHQGPLHAPVAYTYDASGFMTHAVSETAEVWRRNGGWGQADSVWGDQGVARLFLNASNGRVESMRVGNDPALVSTYTYDFWGRLLTAHDPEGHLTRRTWYAGTNGNRSKDSLPGGRVTTYGYDTYGRQTTVTAPQQPTRTTHYDIVNRPDWVDDGVNPLTTRFGYDNLHLTNVTDPKNQVYQYEYNALGWQTGYTDPAGRSIASAYSRDGDLVRWTNRRGESIYFSYDALHRRLARWGTNVVADTMTYLEADGSVTRARNQLEERTTYLNDRRQPDSVRVKFWPSNYDTGVVLRYTYTDEHLLQTINADAGDPSWAPGGGPSGFLTRGYSYTPQRGTLDGILFGNDWTTFGFDNDLLSTTIDIPGANIDHTSMTSIHRPGWTTSATMSLALHYDAVARLDRYNAASQQRLFAYDSLGQLIETVFESNASICNPLAPAYGVTCIGGTEDSTHTYQYDDVGNRTDLGGTYDAGNRVTAFGGCAYEYDDDGNVTLRTCPGETTQFWWSADNRLLHMRVNGVDWWYRYNAFGQLMKFNRAVSGGYNRVLLWSGSQVFALLNWNGSARLADYSYYPGLDNLHAIARGSSPPYFAHQDALGNVVALTDKNNAVKRTYEYDEWGQLVGGTDYASLGVRDRMRFKGALWMGDEVELYYMRNRWYEPRSGRFLSEDPIGLSGGINPYAFASGDPINGSDPTGLDQCTYRPDIHNDPGHRGDADCPPITTTGQPQDRDPFDVENGYAEGWGGGVQSGHWHRLRSQWRRAARQPVTGFDELKAMRCDAMSGAIGYAGVGFNVIAGLFGSGLAVGVWWDGSGGFGVYGQTLVGQGADLGPGAEVGYATSRDAFSGIGAEVQGGLGGWGGTKSTSGAAVNAGAGLGGYHHGVTTTGTLQLWGGC